MYKLIFLFLLSKTYLFSQNVLCDSYFKIAFLPFFVTEINPKESLINDYAFIGNGIAKLIFSNLKQKFFIKQSINPVIYTNFHKFQNQENCNDYALAVIEYIEPKKFFLSDNRESSFLKVPLEKQNLKDKVKNYSISEGYYAFFVGVVILKESDIQIEIDYVNLMNQNHSFSIMFFLDRKDVYSKENLNKIQEISFKIQEELLKSNTNIFSIKIEGDYQVYVNQITYGKNLKKISLPDGDFLIEIYHQKCKNFFRTKEISNKEIFLNCPEKDLVSISITSNPQNSEIFLDEEYIGKTPLDIKVPKKIYRIRISKENFLEQYFVLDLTKNFTDTLNFDLQPKNIEKNKTILSNWGFYDLSFGFGIQSFIFLGGWIHSNQQKEKALSTVRSELIPYFFIDPLEMKLEQYIILENARKKALFWHRQSQIYGGASIASLFLSAFFMYKGIDLDIQSNPYKNLSFRFFVSF